MSRIVEFLRVHKTAVILVCFFILCTTLAFGLGYLVAKEESPVPIIIEKCSG